jgi:ketosteroid isomerase-like protein
MPRPDEAGEGRRPETDEGCILRPRVLGSQIGPYVIVSKIGAGGRCSRSSRTAAGKASAGWEPQLPLLSARRPPLAGQVVQESAAPVGRDRGHEADRAIIEKLKYQDRDATVARDAVAMADLWADDAVRFGPDTPADVGRQAIRATNERSTARPLTVLTFVPETKDSTIWDGGAVEWLYFTASIAAPPGSEPKQVRGTALVVLKKLPDGSWKCFRAMGIAQ